MKPTPEQILTEYARAEDYLHAPAGELADAIADQMPEKNREAVRAGAIKAIQQLRALTSLIRKMKKSEDYLTIRREERDQKAELDRRGVFRALTAIRYGCNNRKSDRWDKLGARGIRVMLRSPYHVVLCIGWPPDDDHRQIGRIDMADHFRPGNIKWIRNNAQNNE